MKKNSRSKVILGLAAILAGTVGVGVTSTVAWFTTQNSATVSFADAVVRGDNTYIAVAFAGNQPTNNHIANGSNGITVTTASNGSSVAITGATTQVTDISGDGKTFYHPQGYKADTNTATGVQTITTNADNITYYIAFNITVTNKASTNTNFFIDAATTVSASNADANSVEAAKSARVAILDGTTLKSYWQPNGANDTTFKYLKTTAGTMWGLASTPCSEQTIAVKTQAETTEEPVESVFHTGDWTAPSATVTDNPRGQLLGNLATLNSSKTITVVMWLDGTISTGDNDCIGGSYKLDLHLTGVAAA